MFPGGGVKKKRGDHVLEKPPAPLTGFQREGRERTASDHKRKKVRGDSGRSRMREKKKRRRLVALLGGEGPTRGTRPVKGKEVFSSIERCPY